MQLYLLIIALIKLRLKNNVAKLIKHYRNIAIMLQIQNIDLIAGN